MDYQYFQNELIKLTWEVSARVLDIYEDSFDIMIKGDRSPLTAADMTSHEMILKRLHELTIDIPVVSEEDQEQHSIVGETSVFWLVDPIDGTKEFINHNGEFTINIALIEEGRPVLGVVGAPALGVCYAGITGQGAIKIMSDSPTLRVPIHVAPKETFHKGNSLKVVGSRSHNDSAAMDGFLSQFGSHEFIAAGSSLKFCLIAEGKAHLYPRLGRTMEWDTAAGQAVLEAAGGTVNAVTGEPLRYGKPGFGNPHFIAQALPLESYR